jgi:hypothetical protein
MNEKPNQPPTARVEAATERTSPNKRKRAIVGIAWILAGLAIGPIVFPFTSKPLILAFVPIVCWACLGAGIGAFFGRTWRGMAVAVGLVIVIAVITAMFQG